MLAPFVVLAQVLDKLFDNREWNQNVRGELVVARRSTGAGKPSSNL